MENIFRFHDMVYIWILLIGLMLFVCFLYGIYAKKKSLSVFAKHQFLLVLSGNHSYNFEAIKLGIIFLALIFSVLALMRPQSDPEIQFTKQSGRDLIFVMDISRSMLAKDLKPNRLERGKQLVLDVIEVLNGDRVALIVFAGKTLIKSPLTHDYVYFKNSLQKISPDDVILGSTHIGDAIRDVTQKLFLNNNSKFKDVILITDGEDHDSFPIEAAEAAAELGIHIHTVGLGSPKGSIIPIKIEQRTEILRHNDKIVRSKLDEKTLRKISKITQGIYVPVQTKQVNLAALYKKYIGNKQKKQISFKETTIWKERYQYFLVISILLLMLELFLSNRKGSFIRGKN